ncbi:pyridoxamine 5'-phosphate oxidase [Gilvimarinus agarilyticus]|uniref:pyridoxamine 5'-phosphate oxidase n=1 Tax=unclassified Gilvimarinus TaxID=2642066 RepID=UPI001C07FA05|nr:MULTISPECIES: pyridoxamine 5'-phosphate oxidase [unclassified Gilvimarinus]MBU2884661.1 pyridoxamine 5'-phosphate oxidase [Gilvimarinus agarilyticus]MDO6569768.1 pyridoxamine 5'-phosphate oxidase [Gilvimarinus sp. 2_MG-2023]MDO6747418.1 pyridoxamine 5'-phosphate oxidase [Gilvimarinus sp. 1_MG-2023]
MSHMFEAKRREYTQGGLRRTGLTACPFELFARWFDQTEAAELVDPTAMVLATADAMGQPSQRIVLLKHLDKDGFVFYTNQASRKGRELRENPKASLLFPWHALDRQVKVAGRVESVSQQMAADYFASRPRQSQLAAWSSAQSEVIDSRQVLLDTYERMEKEFDQVQIPMPESWGGYRVIPERIEFWQGGAYRLHDCFCYIRSDEGWSVERLAP